MGSSLRSARTVAEATQRAAVAVGVYLDEYQARAIAKAACAFADNVVAVEQPVTRVQWEQEGFRDWLRQRMRHDLLDLVTRQGFVPVSLPHESISHRAVRFIGDDYEVPETAVRNGTDWHTVMVTLEVSVRVPPVDREAAVRAGVLAQDATSVELDGQLLVVHVVAEHRQRGQVDPVTAGVSPGR